MMILAFVKKKEKIKLKTKETEISGDHLHSSPPQKNGGKK